MHSVYLLLGSNIGDSMTVLNRAIELLRQKVGVILATSSVYKTEPWSMPEVSWFYNCAVHMETDLTPDALLTSILAIENSLGRIRQETGHYESREIDIDILYYDDLVLEAEHLKIPHPFISLRRFALAPMTELNADLVHPTLNLTQSTMLNACPDTLKIERI